ncbi:MAG TPA: hypothetical protein PKO07_20500 [Pseudomonadota bacterium]|nr:hypothetical protein [Pseudomonadota bacterium]
MRVSFAAAVCTWGLVTCAGLTAQAAEPTDVASSFEFENKKPFGFRAGATYNYTYKTASIGRESLPLLQSPTTRNYLLTKYGGTELARTERVPDLLYTQKRQTLMAELAIGVFRDLEIGVRLPIVLRDERSYNLDPNAGWNNCPAPVSDSSGGGSGWDCVAYASSTYLDGIYPIEPADLRGSTIFAPPVRGATGLKSTGLDGFDTINLWLQGAPVSQKRDPSKPTWVIGVEYQLSIGNVMGYDNTRAYLGYDETASPSAASQALVSNANTSEKGWRGVSDGLDRLVARTALSHKFKYVDPYFSLAYILPIARRSDTPWSVDYGFQQKRPSPQQQANMVFGFEATPWEQKAKGHRLALDFRGGLNFTFLGRGYSEAWELLASSNALICDDQTALPPAFNYKDANAYDALPPEPGKASGGTVTQGTFNPACRTPGATPTNTPHQGYRLPNASPYYQKPYTGITLIENYMTFTADAGVILELFRHMRLRLGFTYARTQGHLITTDDAGTTSYPSNVDRNNANNRVITIPPASNPVCNSNRVDLSCPMDWNPAYRAVINQPGRRYYVDDINTLGGSAMLQGYW